MKSTTGFLTEKGELTMNILLPITLPGQGGGSASATLDDQVAAVLAAVDAAPGKSMIVGHSAAHLHDPDERP